MRVRCAGRGCEHARSSHDAAGRCRVCRRCRGWATARRHWWRELVTATFHADREGWLVRFDLETNTTYYSGVIAVERRRERRGGRREVTDWLEDNPPPTFRAVLEGLASESSPELRAVS